MDGSQSEIAAACISMVDPAWQSTFRYLIEYILDTQYGVTPCFPDKVYKVRRGAGMGLLCSGELCDSTFYKTVEEQILGNLDRWGVIGYFRFRDDILVIIDSPYTTRLDFVYSLKAKSTVWQLKVETVSRSEVCFLDMRIFKGERWHATKCLDVTIYHKEAAQKQILATHSLHPPHTHCLGRDLWYIAFLLFAIPGHINLRSYPVLNACLLTDVGWNMSCLFSIHLCGVRPS